MNYAENLFKMSKESLQKIIVIKCYQLLSNEIKQLLSKEKNQMIDKTKDLLQYTCQFLEIYLYTITSNPNCTHESHIKYNNQRYSMIK